jgi:hypothetical protein
MFASRGTGGPRLRAVALVVVIAFAAGIAVGWGTGLVGAQLATPQSTPSASPSAEPSAVPDVSVEPVEPITRELDDADRLAGLTTLDVPLVADGTFTTVSTEGEPEGDTAAVRWVRIEYEDGLDMNGRALSQFVMSILNDPRGWGAHGRYEFVPTAGASDIRIVIASPTTVAASCPNPHVAALGAAAEPSGDPSPEPTATGDVSCADRGIVMLSQYDWAAGLESYAEDRTASRVYQVNHGVGHVLGDEDGICASGRALIMTDQENLSDDCEPNPWPWPDEPVPDPASSPAPSATPASRLMGAG